MEAKLVWSLYQDGERKWVQILRRKYLDSNDPIRILSTLDPPHGSSIWNFILDYSEIITRCIKWEVNDGQSVHFWEDSWEGQPALCAILDLDTIINETTRLWGRQLSAYGYVDKTNGKKC